MAKKRKHISALKEKDGIDQPNHLSELGAKKLKEFRKKTTSVNDVIKGVLKGHKASLSRAITLIESKASKHQDQSRRLIESCLPHANNSVRIGITGVPGAGKSTFIEVFGKLLVEKGFKVAVLAIDPSSSISKGSILGDKTRMEELVKEKNAFIRPSSSGETLGGVARKTREAIILCEAAGYDIIIIETIGVGQNETAVHSMTDFFLLLKIAGAGDELQGLKRGIIEMADVIVINKVDGIVSVISKEDLCNGEIFNLGTEEENSTATGIETVESILQIKIAIEEHPPRPGDQNRTKANIDKAKKILGYDPKTSLLEGLKAQVNWFKENF